MNARSFAAVVIGLSILAGIATAQRATPETVTGGDLMNPPSTTTRLTKLQSPAMPDATLEAKGKIVKLDSFGVTVANKRGQTQLYLCCHKRVRFEARKGTPLASGKDLSFSDFKVGDIVQVRFEGIHFVVQSLRLVKRPS